MAAYAIRVKREIERWSAEGLIDSGTAEKLARDVEARVRSSISFGQVFAMMAAALLSAAVLIFIAANWDAIPRLTRVAMLFTIIAGGYFGGALFKVRGRPAFAEASWVLAATAFGASIALIAQMYHMSGDEKTAILTWLAGTALAGVALRSPSLTIGAVLLSGVWMLMHSFEATSLMAMPHGWLPLAAGLWVMSYWTRSAPARHLIALMLAVYAWFGYVIEGSAVVPTLLMTLAIGLFAVGRLRPSYAGYAGLGVGIYLHGFIYFLSAAAMLQIKLAAQPLFLLAVVLAFAGIIGALVVAGRQSAPLRWLAYAAFIAELCYVYVELLGTMLGTAGFFMFAGLILGGLAWIVMRLERSFATPPDAIEGTA